MRQKNGRIEAYKNDYLLEPIELKVKMLQYDPALAVKKVASALAFELKLDLFSVKLQKCQFDNL